MDPNEVRTKSFRVNPWSQRWRHLRDWGMGVGLMIGGISLPALGVFMLTQPSQFSLQAQIVMALAAFATGPGLLAAGYFFLVRGPGSRPVCVTVDFDGNHVRFENIWISKRWPSYLSPRASLECTFDEVIAAEYWPRSSGLAVLTPRGCILIPNWITEFHLLSECIFQVARGPMPVTQSARWGFFFGILCSMLGGGIVLAGIALGWW